MSTSLPLMLTVLVSFYYYFLVEVDVTMIYCRLAHFQYRLVHV